MKKEIYLMPGIKVLSLRTSPIMDGDDDGSIIEISIDEDEESGEAANGTIFEEENPWLNPQKSTIWE